MLVSWKVSCAYWVDDKRVSRTCKKETKYKPTFIYFICYKHKTRPKAVCSVLLANTQDTFFWEVTSEIKLETYTARLLFQNIESSFTFSAAVQFKCCSFC